MWYYSHGLYLVAVLPRCGCATVFMLRFSRPVDVPQSLCCGFPALWMYHSLYVAVLPPLWMCHSLYVAVLPPCGYASLYVAVLPPCGCATVFMLRFSRPVDVQSCCGSLALWSLYVAVLPPCGCATVFMLRDFRTCEIATIFRGFSDTHDAIRCFLPAIA
jgi:hypothetical protein